MKRFIKCNLLLILLGLISSCDRISTDDHISYIDQSNLSHEMIVLGDRLENPYKTNNVRTAYKSLYPTKSRDDIQSTNYYVRFLPKNKEEFDLLSSYELELLDHPVDYSIKVDGDYYRDPEVEDDEITWQYTVVPYDFDFPENIEYEIIDECFLAENSTETKSMTDIDWNAVERKSYELTGNGSIISPETKGNKICPSGRITIVDEKANGGKPFGVAGVRVMCNSFIKFSYAYTDRDGYYKIPKEFSAKLRYRLIFVNSKKFSIGFNLILVPASVSTLGSASPDGVNMKITKKSNKKLYTRSVVNNAVYDYITRCGEEDMNIAPPPKDIRIWLFQSMAVSTTPMLHHGAIVEQEFTNEYLNLASVVAKIIGPDIILGTKDKLEYDTIYGAVCHELAHTSHYVKVGNSYWNKYLEHVLSTYLINKIMDYGSKGADYSGHCEVAEMWAYYLETQMYNERYNSDSATRGTAYWFYPQILRYIEDRGVSKAEIFKALGSDINTKDLLYNKFISLYPSKSEMIEQAFKRYNQNEDE